MQAFEKNTKGLTDLVKSSIYSSVANVPELTWIDAPSQPDKPQFVKQGNEVLFTNIDKDVRTVAIYANSYLIGEKINTKFLK